MCKLLKSDTMKENLNDTRLSPHFKLGEFLNLKKYPENIPTMQVVANLTYGCHQLLEPAPPDCRPHHHQFGLPL